MTAVPEHVRHAHRGAAAPQHGLANHRACNARPHEIINRARLLDAEHSRRPHRQRSVTAPQDRDGQNAEYAHDRSGLGSAHAHMPIIRFCARYRII